MSADEKSDSAGGGRPFQLRPSILSGSGFGSPFSGAGSVGDKQNKGFMLRPSALTSAADKIDSLHKTDNRKRQLSNEDFENNEERDDVLKKPKVNEESSGSCGSSSSNKPSEPQIKLTEDIQKPTGIGSFGFDQDKRGASANGRENNNHDIQSKNYFAQTVKPTDKLGFVFGNNTTNTSVGFGALKKDEPVGTADVPNSEVTDDNASATETETTTTSAAFSEDASREKLLENATEYEKTHNNRQHFEEVDKFTGEEGEQHVLHIFCKLHVFDKERKNWLERGRGNLKLNDKCQAEGYFQSRLVFRTQGTNLLQLNTKLWPDMCCEKVKDKSIRISALDPETKEVRVYLITTSIKDALQTYTAIDRRIGALKRSRNSGEEGDNDDDETRNENGDDSTKDVSSENEDDSNSENEQEKTKRQITPGNTECSKPEPDASVNNES